MNDEMSPLRFRQWVNNEYVYFGYGNGGDLFTPPPSCNFRLNHVYQRCGVGSNNTHDIYEGTVVNIKGSCGKDLVQIAKLCGSDGLCFLPFMLTYDEIMEDDKQIIVIGDIETNREYLDLLIQPFWSYY